MRASTAWPGPMAVFAEPRAYGAALYTVASLAAGILAFTWVATGLSLSLGMMPLLIGPLVALAFFALSRGLGRAEQKVLEWLTGETSEAPLAVIPIGRSRLDRAWKVVSDAGTWRALVFLALRLPLGIAGFTAVVTGSALGAALFAAPAYRYFQDPVWVEWGTHAHHLTYPEAFLFTLLGIVVLGATLHFSLLFIRLHGWLGRKLLG